jgi:dihydropteroate synthase
MSVAEYRLMGVLNVTPDSFSDGGRHLHSDAAIKHGLELAMQGADIVDVGGESTRPGAEPVGVEEELHRVMPVIGALAARAGGARISVDTSKAIVARRAIDAGASFVNDVSALRADTEMAGVVADSGAECCLMHMLGEPRTMQREPRYADVVSEVKSFLEERLTFAVGEGIAEHRVLLDPGIGFGKTVEHNLTLLRRLSEIVALGRPVVVGTSRKSFLGRIAADVQRASEPVAADMRRPSVPVPADTRSVPEPVPADSRLPGTIATNVMALERGASVFRVHDVASVADALATAAATLSGKWTARSTTS